MSDDDLWPQHGALTVIEDDRVQTVVDAAVQQYPQAEDMFSALVWRLARDPYSGALIEHQGTQKRIVKLPSIRGVNNPSLVATYTFDDNELVIDWLQFYPYDEQAAVNLPAYIFRT